MNKATVRFLISKILELVATLFIVTIISFLLVRLSPIDPAEAYVHRSYAAYNFTDEQMEGLREEMGLSDSLPVQYLNWIKGAASFDFGQSFVSGRPVFEEVIKAISITVKTVLISAVIQVVFILLFGCLCYWTRGNILGRILTFLCVAGISIPAFYLAGIFIDIFAVKWRFLSVAGNTGIMRYLPAALCLSVSGIAFFSQLLSTGIERAMKEDSAFYARCRGLTERRIMLCHALPQAITGLLPNFMQMLGLCMAGSVIVERVFSLPGLGYLIIDSVLYRDSPMIHATILFLAFSLAVFNIISDVLQRALLGEPAAGERGAA